MEILSDSVFRAACVLPTSVDQQLTKTPALPNGKAPACGPNRSSGARQRPSFGNQQLCLIPGHGEQITDAVRRQVDSVEAFRQFPGQPYLPAVGGSPPHVVKLKYHRHLWDL